jgi:hypothetical protein
MIPLANAGIRSFRFTKQCINIPHPIELTRMSPMKTFLGTRFRAFKTAHREYSAFGAQ